VAVFTDPGERATAIGIWAAVTGLAVPAGRSPVVAAGLGLMSAGFVLASLLDADSAYVGPILASMVTMAAGLGLTTSPATEAIMGALPESKAGVGSAVNDATRELGGTLGVAIVGSVFASLYGPRVAELLRDQPVAVVDAARESIGAAVAMSQQSPMGEAILGAAREAFMSGFSAGSLVAAAATAAGAILALLWLPARASR